MKKIHEMNPAVLSRLNQMLRERKRVDGYGRHELLHTETVKFDRHIEADIKLVNSDEGPFVDPVLFEDGHQIGIGEPEFNQFNNTYAFDHKGETYEVVLK